VTRWLAAACILLIWLTSCGKERPVAAPAEPAQPAEQRDGVVFELLIGRGPDEQRQGLRILGDGQAQARGNQIPRIDDAGRVKLDPVELRWRDVWKYTPDELERVRAVVAGAARGLQPRYAVEQGSTPTGDRLTWHLRSGDRLVEVEVDGAPFATPPALDQLYRRLPALHERPVERTVWRVWTGGKVVERHVGCPMAQVPTLATLRNVLFNPDSIPPKDAPAAEPAPPDGTPLVEIEFLQPDSRYVSRFYADGRRDETRPEGEKRLEDATPEHLAAIHAAIASSDFAALPEPVC
jgi:hypothetical protein